MTDTALILVDIQNDYFESGRWPLHKMDEASTNAARVLEHARKQGQMVVHIHHEIPSDEAPFFRPGSKGAEIHPSVAPVAGEEKILKHRPNSFVDTRLQDTLSSRGISRVIIIGAMSQMCIDATARAAKDLGYDVTVVHDACAARDSEFDGVAVPAVQVHAAFMAGLSGTYARLVDSNSLVSAP
ncbi:nicotinamidase-like amidase [Hoeflea sp. IMCC20628]|uniref:cysteine hydrolase family protein n=1 Tax=Hoeflea sp. IMCC20628 TaxID=1620421 RepID=UPI00063ACD39|nr:cysteine hydrolase family protein [Hoeflea sp. IMCC20628]AKH99924.1 nicotinamidase-like amidase [Hoeflea sp. IMCC20628]